MSSTARILLFTGDGKGKTTTALGMAMRASGHGMCVLIIQFIKNRRTGELEAVKKLDSVEIIQAGMGFFSDKNIEELEVHKKAAQEGLALAKKAIAKGNYKLIILDEICHAISKGLLEEKEVIAVIAKAPQDSCIVLTGRDATAALIDLADTVTEMQCVKHGMDCGIAAQRGVEL